jgi:putative nucleotidyltransferase with HDIG domain
LAYSKTKEIKGDIVMMELIMLCGIPASGKSTWAMQYKEVYHDAHIISSDTIREELFGDVANQDNNDLVFREVFSRIKNIILNGGCDDKIIFDATNISAKRRRSFLKQIKEIKKNIPILITARVFLTPLEKCLEYNNSRERKVPEDVIRRMYFNFSVPTYDEEFHDIFYFDHVNNTGDVFEIIYDGLKNYDIFSAKFEKAFGVNVDMPHDNPHHKESIGEHIYSVIKQIEKKIYNNDINKKRLLFAALLHDVGKYQTKQYKEEKGYCVFYNHENISSQIAACYIQNDFVLRLVKYHMLVHNNPQKAKEYFSYREWKLVEIFAEADKYRDYDKEIIV